MWGSSLSPRQQFGSLAEGALLHICLHLGLAPHGVCCSIACLAAAGHSPLLSLVTAAQCMSGFSCAPAWSALCLRSCCRSQSQDTGHRSLVSLCKGWRALAMLQPAHQAAFCQMPRGASTLLVCSVYVDCYTACLAAAGHKLPPQQGTGWWGQQCCGDCAGRCWRHSKCHCQLCQPAVPVPAQGEVHASGLHR